jgi:hypothetical protein
MTEETLKEKVESFAQEQLDGENDEWRTTSYNDSLNNTVFLRFNGHIIMSEVPDDLRVVSVDNYSGLDVKVRFAEE